MTGPLVRLLRTRGMPILSQLHLEEALYRNSKDNWCVVNDGVESPAIVMGISGKTHELVNEAAAAEAGIQVIKRFTGGGTVCLDSDSVMVSIIMGADATPGLDLFPRPIMDWTGELYSATFSPHGDYSLRENDYVFGSRKFGGNAQAIGKGRWLHHTSFLWDYAPERMALLQHPKRVPDYRAGREHTEFVCRLRDYLPDRSTIEHGVQAALADKGFQLVPASLSDAQASLEGKFIRSTRVIELPSSAAA